MATKTAPKKSTRARKATAKTNTAVLEATPSTTELEQPELEASGSNEASADERENAVGFSDQEIHDAVDAMEPYEVPNLSGSVPAIDKQDAVAAPKEPKSMPPSVEQDITAKQVMRQLDAMGNDKFRVALRSSAGISNTYELDKEELIQKVPYFKMMNVKGNDILIKPIGDNNLVMIDGLDKKQMDAMHVRDGGPAAALQIAPDRYQVWAKVGNEPIPAQERREIAKMLTEEHGGDLAAVTEGHYGRLAGFTNRASELTKADGKQPWVKIETAKGEGLDDDKAAELLTSANATVEDVNQRLEYLRNRAVEAFKDVEPQPGQLNPLSENRDPSVAFKTTAARLFERYGEGFDDAKADWMISKDMALKGWQKEDISKAIQESSSNIEPQKFGAMKEYANRLAGRAAAAVDLSKDKSKSLDKSIER